MSTKVCLVWWWCWSVPRLVWGVIVLECVTRREPQTPGSAKENTEHATPTLNPNDCQSAQLTDQAPGAIERAAQESSRIAQPSKVASSHHHAHPAGSLPVSSQPTQPCAQRRLAETHYNTDTSRTHAGAGVLERVVLFAFLRGAAPWSFSLVTQQSRGACRA